MMIATRFLAGAATLVLVFSTSITWAQEPAAKAAEPDVNEKLAPLGWLIGTWEGGVSNFVDDEIKYSATSEFSWILGGQVLLEETANRTEDGDVTRTGINFYFLDPETKSLGARSFSSSFWQNVGTLANSDADSISFEMDAIQPSGKRGFYKYRLGKDAGGGFRKGWSKVSGEGGNNAGMSFRKLDEEAQKHGEESETNPPEALEKLAWLLGTWRADRGETGINEANTRWILGGKAMLTESTAKDAEGNVTEQLRNVYYIDPVRRQPAVWAVTQTGIIGRGHLAESTDEGVTWQMRVVWPDGGQGHYTRTMSKAGSDAYEAAWSKISGTGPDSFGPYRFERQEKEDVEEKKPATGSDAYP